MTHSRYKIFDIHYPYFMTATVVAWLPLFAHARFVEIILDSWRFLQARRGIAVYGYVIMENHLHWIAAGDDLPEQVAAFKSFTARRIIDDLQCAGSDAVRDDLAYFRQRFRQDQRFQFWQEGSHPEEIQDEAMMRQKLEYIHQTPVRRGYVADPVHWRYSSAGNYAGLGGVLDVETEW